MADRLEALRDAVTTLDAQLRDARDALHRARCENLGIRALDDVTWSDPKARVPREGRVLSIEFAHDHIVKEIVVALRHNKSKQLTARRIIFRWVRLSAVEYMCAVQAVQMKRIEP